MSAGRSPRVLEQVEAEFDAPYRRATDSIHLSSGGMVGQILERLRPVVGYGRTNYLSVNRRVP